MPTLKRLCAKSQNVSGKARFRYDAGRVARLPPPEVAKDCAREAMMDLILIVRAYRGAAKMSQQMRAIANNATLFALQYCAMCGRIGDWVSFAYAHVMAELNANPNHITALAHKTHAQYGDLAKWPSTAAIQLLLAYGSLPRLDSPGFFQEARPPHADADPATAGQLCAPPALRRGGEVYSATCQHQTSNLLRKLLHARLPKIAHTDKVVNLLEQVDAHSADVAMKVYAVRSVADDAELGGISCIAQCGAIPQSGRPTKRLTRAAASSRIW